MLPNSRVSSTRFRHALDKLSTRENNMMNVTTNLRDRLLGAIVLALLPLTLIACDDDPSGPEATGSMTAVVTDGSSGSASSMAALRGESGTTQMKATEGSFDGTTSGEVRVSVFSETRGWVELGSFQNVDVAMQSNSSTTVHAAATVPADTYTSVRYEFEGAESDIFAGADLGSIVLTADVTISFGGSDGNVTIEKSVTPFTIEASSSATVSLDLNSHLWVDDESATGSAATDAEIQAAAEALVSAS